MLRENRTAQAWMLVAAIAAALLAGVPDASAATLPTIRFEGSTIGEGSFSYDGAGGAINGTNIRINTLFGSGTPSNEGVSLTCEDCSLNFMSGANDYEIPVWAFLPGGSFAVTGTAKDGASEVATGTLLSGFFNDMTFASKAGNSHIIVSGSMDVTLNDNLAAIYGTAADGFAIMTQIISLTEPLDLSTNAFQGTSTHTAIDSFSVVPVPVTLPLFLSALAGIAMISRRAHSASA